ncbi:MAG: type II toxin-antitoxin system RelE/ParE family toxin [Ignavibacteria bacterium]|nr:type II toxin-antitoxin system RelE/ParE family toxin [Ignavibacteria bacterium]
MGSFQIKYRASFEREFKRIPKEFIDTVAIRIDALAQNPFPVGCKKLTKEELYRIRVGDYRFIYSVDTNNKVVTIERIKHRKDVYRNI